jgi:hypothetical protein
VAQFLRLHYSVVLPQAVLIVLQAPELISNLLLPLLTSCTALVLSTVQLHPEMLPFTHNIEAVIV